MKKWFVWVLVLVLMLVSAPVYALNSSIAVYSGKKGDHVWYLFVPDSPKMAYIYALHTARAVDSAKEGAYYLALSLNAAVLIYGQDTSVDRNKLLGDAIFHLAYDNEPGDGVSSNYLLHLINARRDMVDIVSQYTDVPIAMVGASKEGWVGYFLVDDNRVKYIVPGLFKMEDLWGGVLEAQSQWGCDNNYINPYVSANPENMLPALVALELKELMPYVDAKTYVMSSRKRDDLTIWTVSQRGTYGEHDGEYFPLGVAEGQFVNNLSEKYKVHYTFGIESDEFLYKTISPMLLGLYNDKYIPSILSATYTLKDSVLSVTATGGSGEYTLYVGFAPTGAWNAPGVEWKSYDISSTVAVTSSGAVAFYVGDKIYPITSPVYEVRGAVKRCYTSIRAVLLYIGDKNYSVSFYDYPSSHGVSRYTMDTVPIIKDDRTFVPLRFVVEALDGEVYWDGTDRRVDIYLKDNHIALWIDRDTYEVNGEKKTMDTAPFIRDSRTMVPIRFVVEGLGGQVWWYPGSRSVMIMLK